MMALRDSVRPTTWVATLALVAALPLLAAEGTARVTGVVEDEEGKPVADVLVKFHRAAQEGESGGEVEARTNKKGKFTVAAFPVGTFYAQLDDETYVIKQMSVDGRSPTGERVAGFEGESDADVEGRSVPLTFVTGLRAKLSFTVSKDRAQLDQAMAMHAAKDASGRLLPLNELFQAGDWAKLEVEASEVAREHPDLGGAVYLHGVALWRLGRIAEAVDVLRRATEVIPDQPGIRGTFGSLLVEYANARRQQGDEEGARAAFAEAAAHLEAQLAETPDMVPYLTNRVIALDGAGRGPETIAALEALVAVDPGNHRAYMHMAEILINEGRPEEAVAAIERMPGGGGETAATVIYNAAVDLWNTGNMDATILALDKALAMAPDMALLYQLKGRSLIAKGQDAEGIRMLKEYLGRVPEDDPAAGADRALVEALEGK